VTRPAALVTGASRGIGAAAAIALAEAGYDLAISARTLDDGDDGRSGSLRATARQAEALGAEVVVSYMDLLDLESVDGAIDDALGRFGHVSTIVNNGVYKGPGDMDPLLGTPLDLLQRPILADLVAPTHILQRLLPPMLDAGGGRVVNVTSMVAHMEPPGPLGSGGWGFGYGVAKGGFDRIAGLVNAELGGQGVIAYNVEPGFVAYGPRRSSSEAAYPGIEITRPEVIGAVIAWLATDENADRFRNKLVHGPQLAADLGLNPQWSAPGS
jgi:NAD(P)-dependent dehydrogenase (short-subunit alcohol dehydrogenase family)